jgi:hypothetical protein
MAEVVTAQGTKTLIGSVLGAITVMGGGFAWAVGNWNEVEQVLHSPAGLVIALLMMFLSGGALVYTVMTLPIIQRLKAAEGVIRDLRKHDQMRDEQMAAMRAKLARLETIIEMAGLPQSLAQLGTIQAPADTETG